MSDRKSAATVITEAADWMGQKHILRPESYWHLASPDGFLLHNAFIGKGFIVSISAVRDMPGLDNAVSLYGFFTANSAKEDIWDRVRLRENPSAPSRHHAMFLLPTQAAAEHAASTWFAKEKRVLVEARVTIGSAVHIADARHLDCFDHQWEQRAKAYWAGEMSSDPVPEVLVKGHVFFPGWECPPFGLIKR